MELNSNIYKYLASLDELPSTEILQVHVQGNRMTSRHSKSKRDSAKSNNYEKWGGRVYSDEKLRKEILGINEIKRCVKEMLLINSKRNVLEIFLLSIFPAYLPIC